MPTKNRKEKKKVWLSIFFSISTYSFIDFLLIWIDQKYPIYWINTSLKVRYLLIKTNDMQKINTLVSILNILSTSNANKSVNTRLE